MMVPVRTATPRAIATTPSAMSPPPRQNTSTSIPTPADSPAGIRTDPKSTPGIALFIAALILPAMSAPARVSAPQPC